MWICPQCHYQNDDHVRHCGHCGASRYASQDGTVVVHEPVIVTEEPTQVAPRGGGAAMGVLLTLLILIALGVVGYLAWQRGVINLPPGLAAYLSQSQPAPSAPAAPVPQAVGPTIPGEKSASEILTEIADMPRKQYRRIAGAVDNLEEVELQLKRVQAELPPQGADETARASQLQRLQATLPKLLESYKAFEDAASQSDQTVYGDQLAALRDVYAGDMGLFVDLLGRVYTTDPNPARPEYALGEQVTQAVTVYGRIPPEEMRQHWLDAVHARDQHQLDRKYPQEYKQLAAWLSTLHELRRRFNDAAKQLPPAEMNYGRLTEGGRGLLELYDAFSTKLEQLWPSWKKFVATLPAKGDQPERMDKEAKEIETLFQTEHLDCFTQMYKIYALDGELTHPAYEHLRTHFQFVEANWPNAALAYRGVYQRYEKEWDDNWKNGLPVNPSGGGDDQSDDQGGGEPEPPGFLPDLPPSG